MSPKQHRKPTVPSSQQCSSAFSTPPQSVALATRKSILAPSSTPFSSQVPMEMSSSPRGGQRVKVPVSFAEFENQCVVVAVVVVSISFGDIVRD